MNVEMPDGTIRKVNVELNEIGKKAQASGTTKEVGYDTRHQYPYPNELPEQSIADSLGGTGNRDPLFGPTPKLYEGAVPSRAPYEGMTKTTVTPTSPKNPASGTDKWIKVGPGTWKNSRTGETQTRGD